MNEDMAEELRLALGHDPVALQLALQELQQTSQRQERRTRTEPSLVSRFNAITTSPVQGRSPRQIRDTCLRTPPRDTEEDVWVEPFDGMISPSQTVRRQMSPTPKIVHTKTDFQRSPAKRIQTVQTERTTERRKSTPHQAAQPIAAPRNFDNSQEEIDRLAASSNRFLQTRAPKPVQCPERVAAASLHPNPLQQRVLPLVKQGRSIVCEAGAHSGRTTLLGMIASTLSRISSLPQMIVLCSPSLSAKIRTTLSPFIQHGSVVVYDDVAYRKDPPQAYLMQDIALVALVWSHYVSDGTEDFDSACVDDLITTRLKRVPQILALPDYLAKTRKASDMEDPKRTLFSAEREAHFDVEQYDLMESITSQADEGSFLVPDPQSSTTMILPLSNGQPCLPLHHMSVRAPIRQLLDDVGGLACNLLLSFRSDSARFSALASIVHQLFDRSIFFVVCNSQRKSQRLAEACNDRFIRAVAASTRSQQSMSEARQALLSIVARNSSAARSGGASERLAVVCEPPALLRLLNDVHAPGEGEIVDGGVIFFDTPPQPVSNGTASTFSLVRTLPALARQTVVDSDDLSSDAAVSLVVSLVTSKAEQQQVITSSSDLNWIKVDGDNLFATTH